ncbi:S-adenosyl-L-methionine-dependent methyltransferase [Polyplosphaeria fusca]|uniref:S-adenosyl-L-methionine-dependent methyltransferase n=1 Tax=Polyplosphaeria fusca TaxID=682080 RepID=A0A9P4QNQ3_9PLEO|nr:S-adenosyl-L-methionine-dependent methyltransferase [Polyplosphaeria fusca]
MPHNFLADDVIQPVEGADVYLMRWVLHDFSDACAIKILRTIVPALKKGSRVMIMDLIFPEPGTLPVWRERDLRQKDLQILTLFNAKERTLEEWKILFCTADPRLVLKEVFQPKGSTLIEHA